MPVTPTYPGVYVEEIPSGVRTIVGVSTAVTAFVGYLRRGPLNEAVQLLSYADFERQFGGLDKDSLVSYGVRDFFLNGGTEAWVVRTAAGTPTASGVTLETTVGGGDVLEVVAANEGTWGDRLRLEVDRDTSDPGSLFNLSVVLYQEVNGALVPATSEVFRNLSMDSASADYVVDKINEDSDLIRIPEGSAVGATPPAANGTVLDVSAVGDLTALTYPGTVNVNLTTGGVTSSVGVLNLASAPASLTAFRTWLQTELRALAAGLSATTASLIQSDDGTVILLQLRVNGEDPADILAFSGGTAALANLTANQVANAQQYLLGQAVTGGTQSAQSSGSDGSVSTATELIGSESAKTGLWALEDVDLVNLLCLPLTSTFDDDEATAVLSEAIAYCERRRAFLIVDIPEDVNEVDEIRDWVDNNASALRSDHAALYFPRIRTSDPLNDFRARAMPSSGLMAGLYARTDSERGVWKAPAGTEAVLRNVKELDYKLSDAENGTLNPLAINCLRNFPVYGNISWGARTLRGADRLADEYKYIPVRRLALFLEESLYRGLKWVVFEPNDEPLWAQIRLNVGAFLHNLFRQGAFQGTKPSDAYFVKCDGETTTQNDRNLGIVNIVVGFAPLKPAEFVILKIQQIAGQIET